MTNDSPKNELFPQDSTPPPSTGDRGNVAGESVSDGNAADFSAVDDDDAAIGLLLRDAYAAPRLPNSLLQRLDQGLTEEWGHSPGLVQTRASILTRLMSLRSAKYRNVRIAMSTLLVVAAVVLFGKWTPAYAWASVVKAMERQDVVRLDGPDVSRWISVSKKVMGERSGTALSLIDWRQMVLLNRKSDDDFVRRRKVHRSQEAPDADRMILSFMLGNRDLAAGTDRQIGHRLVRQTWNYVQQDQRKLVSLKVRWETELNSFIDMELIVDPTTQLPVTCSVAGSDINSATSLKMSYPVSGVASLLANDFPPEYAAIDVDEHDVPIVKSVAAADAVSERINSNANNEIKTASVAPIGDGNAAAEPTVDVSPTSRAASAWKPVVVTSRSRDDVIRQIDSVFEDLWQAQGIEPAPAADDEELLRRVYLDLVGRTPSVYEIRAYLKDKSRERYEQLVDRLLNSRDHSSHLATVWRSFLIPEGIDLTAFGGVEAFDRWLAEKIGNNEPYDSIVRSLLLAEGRLSRSGPLLFYSAAKLDPDQLAARTARVFLGLRLECAQCHDHPFEPWKQEEFWGLAAYFARISRPRGELQKVSTIMQVRDVDHGDVKLPKSNTIIEPHLLNGDSIAVNHGGKADAAINAGPGEALAETRRHQLATWVTAAGNPYFSRATVNRVWSIMFAKGLVDPVDDFGTRHPPKSSETLELLAGHLIDSRFNLAEVFRTIALSRAYRLSSGAEIANPRRQEWFAQMNVKTLTAEQVYDCMTIATLRETEKTADPFAFNVARYGNSDRELFLNQFRTPAGRGSEYLGGIPQALTLMNGKLIESATGVSQSGLLKSLEAPFFTNEQRVEVLYLSTLSRYPRKSEWELLQTYVNEKATATELKENLSDILWSLLNSAEFTMNH